VTARTYTDDLQLLISCLPAALQDALAPAPVADLLEIIMDLGRLPQARFPGRAIDLAEHPVSHADLNQVVEAVGEFAADNRAGIEGTLHRISALRNRRGDIVGLTLRIGRAVLGTIDLIRDLVESGNSILLLGRPGIGKTTKLREIARVLADDFGKRVVVIDTSNEIAGDGDIAHPAIGSARRMQVPHPERQHAVMIEAVENHMPEVIIVDEIGNASEALAARTIAERGVQLVATAHGNTLENVLMNPTLSDLVGGVQTVTLGDEEARLRHTQKTISERKASPTFDTVVEIVDHDDLIVHHDTAASVDDLLRGRPAGGVRRTPGAEEPATDEPLPRPKAAARTDIRSRQGTLRIYPYAISRDSIERVLRDLRVDARTTSRPERADLVVALRARVDDPRLRRIVAATDAPVEVVKKNTTAQLRRLLLNVFNVMRGVDEEEVNAALREAETAAERVIAEGVAVELAPCSASLRELQHRVAVRHQLVAESHGSEPLRHLVILPG
jgi:stage III sporulation protein SpoIIIAA